MYNQLHRLKAELFSVNRQIIRKLFYYFWQQIDLIKIVETNSKEIGF